VDVLPIAFYLFRMAIPQTFFLCLLYLHVTYSIFSYPSGVTTHFLFSILVYLRLDSIRTGVVEETAERKRRRAKALNKASRKASPMLEP